MEAVSQITFAVGVLVGMILSVLINRYDEMKMEKCREEKEFRKILEEILEKVSK